MLRNKFKQPRPENKIKITRLLKLLHISLPLLTTQYGYYAYPLDVSGRFLHNFLRLFSWLADH